jgi:hypothetical protein
MTDTLHILEQSLSLLHRLDGATYTRILPPIFQSGIGTHLRHCLDFYGAFLRGICDGRIDYDTRERDTVIEQNREAAIAAIETTIQQMTSLNFLNEGMPVLVRLEDASADESSWCQSTIGRELQALKSHTIHHYALIAVMVKLQGISISADFGVSTSTLRQQQAA